MNGIKALISNRFSILALAAGIQLTATFAQAAPQATAKALPFVSPLFSDNMVLQRGKSNTIWGWSDPGASVHAQILDETASSIAGPDRRWQVKIQPPPARGPYTIKINGPETVELHNVLVGDVWLCGGQSNMGVGLRQARNGAEEVKAADQPEIRFFTVRQRSSYRQTDIVEGEWKVVSPETAANVSAVGYYFARRVREDVHVPIGLVQDNVGGTPVEAWTSTGALAPLGDFDIPLAELRRLAASGAPEYGNYIMHWYDQYDAGMKNGWAAPELDDATWKPVDIPGGFAELGVPETPAVAWFRREITLPEPLPAGRAMLLLGSIERMDTAYINGTSVGASAWVENPRAYPLFRPGVLKPGRNVIVLRILKVKPEGGFLGKREDLRLTLGDGTSIPLAGKWKGRLSVDARLPHPLPIGYENWPTMPSVLYNGMLAPVAPLSLTGALWYQGEQNSERGYQYRKILPVMIADWRKLFGQGDFPFYVVSLPAFKSRSDAPVDDAWAETRESQALTVAAVPNTCLAVTIDTGEADNIHPKEKAPVGDRLARCALARHYGEKIAYLGPALSSVERLPDLIKLHFANTEGGLAVKGDKLQEFAIAGEDRKWYWADARVEGDTIVVSSPSVSTPQEVRYAWQSNPAANLFNGAGLPAAPFRTDKWPGITDGHRPY